MKEESRGGAVTWIEGRPAKGRRLIFTSAGPHACVDMWMDARSTWDLMIAEYDQSGLSTCTRDSATWRFLRQGTKFQNLHYAMTTRPELFQGYESIFVVDDDLYLSARGIEHLFDTREKMGLDVLAPSFLSVGRVSHRVTKFDPRSRLRFTNFVEMGAMMCEGGALSLFIQGVYTPELVGFGVDWWFAEYLDGRPGGARIAISDEVLCVNPHEAWKDGTRAIDTIQGADQRRATWEELKSLRGLSLEHDGVRVEGCVARSGLALPGAIIVWGVGTGLGVLEKVARKSGLRRVSRGLANAARVGVRVLSV